MPTGQIVTLTYFEEDQCAVFGFATGGLNKRSCNLWQASGWANDADW